MEAWLKYLGNYTDNYTRYGKEIPKQEKKIDICRFFNVREEREKSIIDALKSDKKIFFKLHKGG